MVEDAEGGQGQRGISKIQKNEKNLDPLCGLDRRVGW